MPRKKTNSRRRAAWIGTVIGALFLLLAAEGVSAAPCDITSSAPLIRHDLSASPSTSNSYCELCGTGYITVVISNPYDDDTDMTDMTLVADLQNSGLTFDDSVLPRVWVNGVDQGAGADPGPGPYGSVLTWTSTDIGELANLASNGVPLTASTLTIRFAVTRVGGATTHEGLISADRTISTSVEYTAVDTSGATSVACGGMPQTEPTGDVTLPLREPNPTVTKLGRNVDAGQGVSEYSQEVYGNNDDDIIWRIEVDNSAGTADLQDLRLDDVMDVGSLGITDLRYICDSEVAATDVAVSNVVDSDACDVFPAAPGDRIMDYDVDLPFTPVPAPAVDVPAGSSAYLYLVGKIPNAPNGSCSSDRVNTVSDVQWGCDAQSPAGGIDETSFYARPGSTTATLNTFSSGELTISVDYDGVGGAPYAGTKGRVIITIINDSGGTVSDLVLTNDLPPEYVVDATFEPTITARGAYGPYNGLTNDIDWDNRNGNPLLNNIPQFTLTSSAATNDGHANLLRHGDQLEITFGIILVRSASYDRVADLDVITEAPGATTDDTDPNHAYFLDNLPNTVSVDFNDFCTGGPNTDSYLSRHTPRPEDLDIQTYGPSGPVLDYILTNNNDTPLTVRLTNNGGHRAADYYVYIVFGRTMEVDLASLPSGCTDTPTDMPPLIEWQNPLGFPAEATIIECKEYDPSGPDLPAIARNGGYLDLDFIVRKSTVPEDIAADDLTFRADVIGEITLTNRTRLTFPPIVARGDGITDRANNYSIDAIRARVMGFNLNKSQAGNCSENNPPNDEVQIGEECSYHIRAGGWFGFLTPGYTPIEVRNIRVDDVLPNGQGYVDRSAYSNTGQIDVNPNFQRAVAPTPPTQYDMAEGTLFWTFNETSPYITQRNEWFEVDVRTRLLNDPIDASAVPNRHADSSRNTLTSNFNVVFLADDPVNRFTVPYGPSMSVYPPVADRRVTITVTEPEITVVKEVCNESLSPTGGGPGCTPWVTAANNGDALNTYIYRLTVTNEA
ncbi:MAG: hypothetical protein QNJ58_19420, partial [Desulfobacterales bacterium]|nr:hypothetical protein [Desulfobacterales bacterium]